MVIRPWECNFFCTAPRSVNFDCGELVSPVRLIITFPSFFFFSPSYLHCSFFLFPKKIIFCSSSFSQYGCPPRRIKRITHSTPFCQLPHWLKVVSDHDMNIFPRLWIWIILRYKRVCVLFYRLAEPLKIWIKQMYNQIYWYAYITIRSARFSFDGPAIPYTLCVELSKYHEFYRFRIRMRNVLPSSLERILFSLWIFHLETIWMQLECYV